MKKYLLIFFFSTIASAKIFVIDKNTEIPFEAAHIKKSLKKDMVDYLDSTDPILKRLGDSPYNLALLAVGPTVAANVGIGPWQIGGNVGFYLVFVRKKDQL